MKVGYALNDYEEHERDMYDEEHMLGNRSEDMVLIPKRRRRGTAGRMCSSHTVVARRGTATSCCSRNVYRITERVHQKLLRLRDRHWKYVRRIHGKGRTCHRSRQST